MPKLPGIKSIYTDGACSGNPGPGGWGTVIYFTDGAVHELGGADPESTNNRMEIQAAIAGLEFLLTTDQNEPISLYTDSEYVKNGITKWIKGWKKKGWKTSTGKPVLNQDLWETLDDLNNRAAQQLETPVDWRYVKGHSGDMGNERCDQIARAFSLGRQITLKQGRKGKGEKGKGGKGERDELASAIATAVKAPADLVSDIKLTPSLEANNEAKPLESRGKVDLVSAETPLADPGFPPTLEKMEGLSRQTKVMQFRTVLEALHMADELAEQGYLITTTELADLIGVSANAITSRGEYWTWRNWTVSRVQREGNQILWQLERID